MFSPKEFRRSTLKRRSASSRRRSPSLGVEQFEKRMALSVSPIASPVTIVIRHGQDSNGPSYGTRQAGWDTALKTAINPAETKLIAPISSAKQTSISVASVSGFPNNPRYSPFMIQIDNEIVKVIGSAAGPNNMTTWTVVRGQVGTTPATHLKAATVSTPGGVAIKPLWFESNANKIPANQFYTDTTRLGLPTPAVNGTSFRLGPDGSLAAKSYKTVLPNLLAGKLTGQGLPVFNALPISRVMVDSFARGNKETGTPNPLDTALPFIIDTVTGAASKPKRPLDIDVVVKASSETQDKDAWKHDNVKNRLRPMSSDAGSVLIVSTVQGLWSSDKVILQPDSITGNLVQQYSLPTTYLGANLWKPPSEKGSGSFDKVIPQKGTTIYVYGELNNNTADGNEVYVYSQIASKNAKTSTVTFLGGKKS